MKLLNVGCGSVRPPAPWINMDNLHEQLKPGTPERINLDKEDNYFNHDISEWNIPWPFPCESFDGILVSHVLEHFDCHGAVYILKECKRLLIPGGVVVVSVPDTEYFLNNLDVDTPEKAVQIFGEPICPDEPWHKSFFDYALWYNQHKQLFSFHTLYATMIRSGFEKILPFMLFDSETVESVVFPEGSPHREIEKIMNRRKFSLEMCAVK